MNTHHTHISHSNTVMEHQYSPTLSKHTAKTPSSFQELERRKELFWPPRSYSCSFCQREFRSSQALGGHMNVHRRDRAMLKQLYSPTSSSSPPDQSLDSATFFHDVRFRGLQMFPCLETRKPLLDETVVSCKRIKKSERNSPCLHRELLMDCKKISGSIQDVDLELRLGSKPQ